MGLFCSYKTRNLEFSCKWLFGLIWLGGKRIMHLHKEYFHIFAQTGPFWVKMYLVFLVFISKCSVWFLGLLQAEEEERKKKAKLVWQFCLQRKTFLVREIPWPTIAIKQIWPSGVQHFIQNDYKRYRNIMSKNTVNLVFCSKTYL